MLCPWAEVMYAMDRKFWLEYPDVAKAFQGRKIAGKRGVPGTDHVNVRLGQNSGVGALHLAAKFGAKHIIMLGYDCMTKGALRHWHGDHRPGLGNAVNIHQWHKQFSVAAGQLKAKGVTVTNCSRATALGCFETGALEEMLWIEPA